MQYENLLSDAVQDEFNGATNIILQTLPSHLEEPASSTLHLLNLSVGHLCGAEWKIPPKNALWRQRSHMATHMHAVEAFMESASEGAKRRYEASADPAQVAQIVRRRSLDMSGQPVPWSEDVQ